MSVKGDYLKHKGTLNKYGKLMVAASIVTLVAFLLLLFLPCFSIGGIFSFSLFDELKIMIAFISDLISGNVSGTYTIIFNMYSIMISVTIIVGIIKALIIAISTISKMTNADMYIMETYDKIVHRSENKKGKKSGPWDMAYASLSMLIVDIILVRLILNVSPDDFFSITGGVSNIIFVDGITIWGIIVAVVFVAIIVLNIIASSYVRTVKKAVIKAEYEEAQREEEREKQYAEEPFEEIK